MAEKKFKGAPFGIQTARFDVAAIHPKSKMPGTFTEAPYCKTSTSATNVMLGPGRYDVGTGSFSGKAVDERAAGPGWARAYEVERMAALPHLLYKEQWQAKRILEKKRGPGRYHIKDFLQAGDEKPRSTHGILNTREVRFKEKYISETPGPGTYGKGGIPHAAIEEKQNKSTSDRGFMEAMSVTNRSPPMKGSGLAPGSYKHRSFTDDLQKVTSLRGPYDLFSSDRNKPIRIGHLAVPSYSSMGPGQYDLNSFLDEFNSEHKKRSGRFGKAPQYQDPPTDRIYCATLSQKPRPPSDPGPGSYEAKSFKESSPAKNSPAFLSSAKRNDKIATKFFTGNYNPVGPGRYSFDAFARSQHKNGHTSLFKSRSELPVESRARFLGELIRSKDVHVTDRVFLVAPHVGSRAGAHVREALPTQAPTQPPTRPPTRPPSAVPPAPAYTAQRAATVM